MPVKARKNVKWELCDARNAPELSLSKILLKGKRQLGIRRCI
jgi:hypothetical protein